mmetsp:Transcript_24403/g.33617  ORF Transcript_24403/g.33617 Transcript_24403/m.33617 type:complete len:261 (-) Transcript_24403:199-981(-)|eukprot:CAMPEP_0196581290 /NCGR_PEP_ID=MMETSP1081-20130531/33467_1 /TAXON_ID=36882 /ORGANISM="Pyramimonas amylifera, Strain CCMP720" /LENGTH=260 /DNA_ID=CAMNT_0041901471 /DNA_START=150 /DNA_END=932 /DNA_ORIENTATION=+
MGSVGFSLASPFALSLSNELRSSNSIRNKDVLGFKSSPAACDASTSRLSKSAKCCESSGSRRSALAGLGSLALFAVQEQARAADQVTLPQKGVCTECIGLVDETLGSCDGFNAGTCLSTFDDRPAFFLAPWEIPAGSIEDATKKLVKVVKLYEGSIVTSEGGYVYATFKGPDGEVQDDVEFYVSDRDSAVVLRGGSRNRGFSDLGRIKRRFYLIRVRLGWDEIPILRNRKNKFLFFESPWDDFGPETPPGIDYRDVNIDY